VILKFKRNCKLHTSSRVRPIDANMRRLNTNNNNKNNPSDY
jgi:hypothetical protein